MTKNAVKVKKATVKPKSKTIKKVKTEAKQVKPRKMGQLVYMGIYAKGESMKMLMWHARARASYTLKTITREQVAKLRNSGKLVAGQVPVWFTPEGQ